MLQELFTNQDADIIKVPANNEKGAIVQMPLFF